MKEMIVDIGRLGLFRQQRIGEAVCQGRNFGCCTTSAAAVSRHLFFHCAGRNFICAYPPTDRGEVTPLDFLAIRSRLHKDRAYWELVEAGPIVLSQSDELLQKTGLRTLDALHAASALIFQTASGLTVPFITADKRQRDTAEAFALNLIWVA